MDKQDWQKHPIIIRADGSYVIMRNGRPYHVLDEGEFAALWADVHVFAQVNPNAVQPEPLPPPPTEEELAAQREAAFNAAINTRLHGFAQAHGWDSLERVLAQAGAFADDARQAQAAYDATWEAALPLLDDVRSGALDLDEALARLPELVWQDAA
ncbi:MAG: hypothetical protein LBH94_07360 [Deltaproteobacteria bacterium]|nr:hypothetical protein [Deltaproteobacteria bacterium]